MADRVFFVTGSPGDLLRGVPVPQEMISDLLEISRVPSDAIEQIGSAVEQAIGFLDDSRLEELVRGVIREESAADAVVNALRNLRPATVQRTLNAVEDWRNADPGHVEKFPEDVFDSVRSKLPRLVRPSAALERHRKATRLSALTGHQGKHVEFLCDARPIFDPDRQTIEGFVTQTIFKLVYESQTEDIGCIEVVISPELLGELLDKAEKAKRKLDVLRSSVQRWIPEGLAEDTSHAGSENQL
jgi:hypothetical protein